MPPQATNSNDKTLRKTIGLTPSQLSSHDDLITDALVDHVYFWSTIRKSRSNYRPNRGFVEKEVCKILQQHVTYGKDSNTALEKLLRLPGLQRYAGRLKSQVDKVQFEDHLRRYINIYMPDCPFEVVTSNRYTIETPEAAVAARKQIREGEHIKYLTGISVEMTEQEEQDLSSHSTFSIVISSRHKRPFLFLGPARFANHDCQANARLHTMGTHIVQVQALKDIAIGEEINVTYGEDYFGADNRECLCRTCEKLLRNGWDPLGPVLPDHRSDDEAEGVRKERKATLSSSMEARVRRNAPLRGKRRYQDEDVDGEAHRRTSEGRPRKYPRPDKAPVQDLMLDRVLRLLYSIADRVLLRSGSINSGSGRTMPTEQDIPGISDAPTISPVDRTVTAEDESEYGRVGRTAACGVQAGFRDRVSAKTPTTAPTLVQVEQYNKINPQSYNSRLPSMGKGRGPTNLGMVVNLDHLHSDPCSLQRSPAPLEAPNRELSRPRAYSWHEDLLDTPMDTNNSSFADTNNPAVALEVSSATSLTAFGDGNSYTFAPGQFTQQICDMLTSEVGLEKESSSLGTVKSSRLPSYDIIKEAEAETVVEEQVRRGKPRKPGDYRLCTALLLDVHYRWVICRNCDEPFVQDDTHRTKLACHRCERHGRLYGYDWPKTDKEGTLDRTDRVVDHRQINRYMGPQEERLQRKGRKALLELRRTQEMR